jgi:hypothetical protein
MLAYMGINKCRIAKLKREIEAYGVQYVRGSGHCCRMRRDMLPILSNAQRSRTDGASPCVASRGKLGRLAGGCIVLQTLLKRREQQLPITRFD